MLETSKSNTNKLFLWIDVFCLIGSLIICIILFFKNGIDVSFSGWLCATLSTLNVVLIQLRK